MKRTTLARLVNEKLDIYGDMTVRQIYYQLIAPPLTAVPHTTAGYKAFDSLLVRCREDGLINADRIIEGSRPLANWVPFGYQGVEEYLASCRDGYFRYPLERQPHRVEIWVEKDALRRFIMAAIDLPIPNLATRGYSPYQLLHEARKRVNEVQQLVILQFGDFDPTGLDIYRDIREKIPDATVERVALTKEQVEQYRLPPMPGKKSDSRYRFFVKEYGDITVELDALPPDAFRMLVSEAVNRWIDWDIIAAVESQEAEEAAIVRAKLT